jgi:hypothetical protein
MTNQKLCQSERWLYRSEKYDVSALAPDRPTAPHNHALKTATVQPIK